jgi:5-methylcytosine-specific restriction endonuclease McrA
MSYNLTYYNSVKKSRSKHRKSVPKALKDRLWDTTYGPEAGQGKCYVCGAIINSKRFEAGHIISVFHGGETTLDNLKCICSTCNKSMGTQNLENFKRTYFPAIRNSLKNKTMCHCCCHNHTKSKVDVDETTKKNKEIEIKDPVKKINKSLIYEPDPVLNYDDSDSDIDSEEERKKERQRKLLLMLDQYRYIPNKGNETQS